MELAIGGALSFSAQKIFGVRHRDLAVGSSEEPQERWVHYYGRSMRRLLTKTTSTSVGWLPSTPK